MSPPWGGLGTYLLPGEGLAEGGSWGAADSWVGEGGSHPAGAGEGVGDRTLLSWGIKGEREWRGNDIAHYCRIVQNAGLLCVCEKRVTDSFS